MSVRVALVTGASRGIGYATALLLAKSGWQVAICSRREQQIQEAAAAIAKESANPHVAGFRADMGSKDDIQQLFLAIDRRFDRLDALVNNAGSLHMANVTNMSDDNFEDMLRTNVSAVARASRQAFMRMEIQGGSIVNISSLAGISGTEKFPGLWAYTACKFAVTGLTEAMAVEGREFGIRVNCIAPGAVDTDMLHKAAPFVKARAVPDDIAHIALFLCQKEQSGILTGTTIPVYSNG